MSTALIIDILIVAALGLAVFWGAKKGFVLTLCSLVAVIVALIGANFLADAIAPKLADKLEPVLESSIQEHLEDYAAQAGLTPEGLTAGSALSGLKERGGVYQWAAEALEDAFQAELTETAAHIAAQAATSVAAVVTHSIILLVGFLVVLIAWMLLAHALDLVARLPVLSGLNRFGGALLGLLKGVVLVWVVLWVVCDLAGWISAEAVSQTYLTQLMLEYSPFRLLMVV